MGKIILPHTIDAATDITAVEHQENYVAIRDKVNGDLEGGPDNNLKANGVTAREIADAILLKGMATSNMQEGVVAAGDLKVTPGAGLVLNYAAGSAWVTDDSGLLATGALLPVTVSAGSSVTVAANASGNPRIDQIILTMTGHNTGTVSVLQGTATGGATLDNRSGAASLPNDAVRLADILMPNGFAGPFVQTTHIRDRRPFARGAHKFLNRTQNAAAGNDYTTTSTSLVEIDAANLKARLECSGGPVTIKFKADVSHSVAGGQFALVPCIDGSPVDSTTGAPFQFDGSATATRTQWRYVEWKLTPSAGSHVFTMQWIANTAGTLTALARATIPVQFEVYERIVQDADNSGA